MLPSPISIVVNFFTDSYSGLPKVRQRPYTINPGDSFVTKFWFESDNVTGFGPSSFEEMNEAVMLYYPAKSLLNIAPWGCTYNAPLGACNSSMSSRVLASTAQLERIFGSVPSQCSAKATLTSAIDFGSKTSAVRNVFDSRIISFISFVFSVFFITDGRL